MSSATEKGKDSGNDKMASLLTRKACSAIRSLGISVSGLAIIQVLAGARASLGMWLRRGRIGVASYVLDGRIQALLRHVDNQVWRGTKLWMGEEQTMHGLTPKLGAHPPISGCFTHTSHVDCSCVMPSVPLAVPCMYNISCSRPRPGFITGNGDPTCWCVNQHTRNHVH